MRVVALVIAVIMVLGIVLAVVANLLVVSRTDALVTDEVSGVRTAQVEVVPGSSVRSDGSPGGVVEERIQVAVAL